MRKKDHGDAEMFAKIMTYDDNDNKTVLRSLVELHDRSIKFIGQFSKQKQTGTMARNKQFF